MNTSIKKAVILCRVSSREQELTGYSLDAQEKLLTEYGEKNGIAAAKVFRISESASGKQIRKMYNEMLAYATVHKIPNILCEKIDRLTRNLKDAAIIDDWVKGHPDRAVHFVKEGFVLNQNTKAHENLVWDMKVAIARFYTNNLSEEIHKGQNEKLAQGWIPMRAKLGYKSVGEKGHKTHIIDEAIAPFIRKMFDLYATGNYSIAEVAKVMRKEGLKSDRGETMSKSQTHILLSDPYYIGVIMWKGKAYEGKHQPLISHELFAKVQRQLNKRFKNPTYRKHLPVFKAKMTCDECGGTIAWGLVKGHWYGNCNHHKPCSQKGTTRQEAVEGQAVPLFVGVAPKTERAIEWLKKALKENHKGEIAYNAVRREELARAIKTADQRMEGAYRDKLDGQMPAAICEKVINEATIAKKEAADALETIADSRQAYYEAGIAIHELAARAEAIYRSPKTTTEEQRLLLSYGFLNLGLKAHKIRPEYTLAFQFMREWIPVVNTIFKSAKDIGKSDAFELSEEEKSTLYHHRDLNPSSRRERAVSWTRLDDDGSITYGEKYKRKSVK